MYPEKKKGLSTLYSESVRIADVQIEKVWQNIIDKNHVDFDQEFQDIKNFKSKVITFKQNQEINWKGKALITSIEQYWILEKVSFKKTKVIAIRIYKNPFYFLEKFFLKKRLQKELDQDVEQIVLSSF